MRFLAPWYALLFLPMLVGLVLSWKHVHGVAKVRKRFAFVLRGIVGTCLILALMGPQSERRNEGLATIVVVDRSESVSGADREASLEFVRDLGDELGPNDVMGVVSFGRDAAVEIIPGPSPIVRGFEAAVDGSSSDLASALRLASASFPEGKDRRIVVLSDGNQTEGDAALAADVAARQNIEVDHIKLGVDQRPAEAAIVSVQAPSEVGSDRPFDLRVTLESTVEQEVVLLIDRDGELVERRAVTLSPGLSSVLVDQELREGGFYRYRATLEPSLDTDDRNNVGAGFVSVRDRPRVLVAQPPGIGTALIDAISEQGIEAVLAEPGRLPIRPEDVQAYDAVVLNDIEAVEFTRDQQRLLEAAARDSGVGLAMIGGEGSFLPGGWYGSPVADALPVDLNVRQRKVFPSTSVAIIVDASGSMGMIEGGLQKIQLAALAANETVELLSANDRIGVAGSTDAIEFVAPMQRLTDKTRVKSQIRRLQPGGGGIYVEPSVREANAVLREEQSQVRHFILLADGADADMYGSSLAIAAEMFDDKITTSVVAIGDGKDVGFLRNLASVGGGRFYMADNASSLPAIFTQDVAIMSRSAIEEGAFFPRASMGEPILRGIGETPALFAYCLTDARPLARVGMRTHKDDPLLATWTYGLATTLAFTSDAQPRWASDWVQWGGFGSFWGQAIQSIVRRASDNRYEIDVAYESGKAIVQVEATDEDGRPLNVDDPSVVVSDPEGGGRTVRLTQEAPGVYSGEFVADSVGSYVVSVSEGTERDRRVTTSGFAVAYPPEYRSYRTDRALLETLSERTGGRELQSPAEAFRATPETGTSLRDLWFWFVLAAAILVPIDVAARRLALPVAEMLAAVAGWRRRRAVAEVQSPESIGRLKSAKARVRPSEQTHEASSAPTPTATARTSKPKRTADPDAGESTSALLASKRRRRGD